jgi:hypothetical protein
MNHKARIAYFLVGLTCPIASHAASYVQNFDTFADGTTNFGDGTVLSSGSGFASAQNGALRLTSVDDADESSAFRIPGLIGSTMGWTATFDVKVGSDGLPADGFSFSWGAGIGIDPFSDAVGTEEGWGEGIDHLYFAFDTFDNGGGEWGLKIGGANATSEFTFTEVFGPLIGVEETANAQVILAWSPTTGASFRTTGFNTNINVSNIPTSGFIAEDANVFAFGARTGSLTETLSVDNINIQSVPEPGALCLLALGTLAIMMQRRRDCLTVS